MKNWLVEDLKNAIREEIKQEIFDKYSQCARWDNANFDTKATRFELADLGNDFVQEMIRSYMISYEEYLKLYCEVRNDGVFFPDAIEDVDAFVSEKLAKERKIKQMIEVWHEDNYDHMKGESHPYRSAVFESLEEAIAYMQEKLDAQMRTIAQNAESVEELIKSYKYGGTDYFIKGATDFSSWKYVEREAKRIYEEVKKEKS